MRPAALAMGAAFLHESPEAVEAIQTALELGVNYFDTYPGHHEEKWGEALSGVPRSSYYLQAKIGTHPERRKDFSGEGARWSLDQSLRSLKTDYLDCVLVHDPADVDELLREGAVFDVLREMKSQGVVRNIGLGARSHDWHVRLIDEGINDVSLTFLDYTLVNQSAADTIFPAARGQKTGIILASVQGMGLLTGEKPDPERERGMHPGSEPRAHRIWTWCREYDVNIRHLAIQFCLAAPVDSVVMFGPASIQHVHDAYEAATDTIPPELWEKLDQAFGIRPGMDAGQS
jgi:aryl-alcohol dehydrogenase-like predicted oxidoreductase